MNATYEKEIIMELVNNMTREEMKGTIKILLDAAPASVLKNAIEGMDK